MQKGQNIQLRHDRTLVFTNCHPELDKEQLSQLVQDAAQSSDTLKSANFKPHRVLFKLENYLQYNKEARRHDIIEGIYQTKVGFVEFSKRPSPELVDCLKNLFDSAHGRNIFGAPSLTEPVDRRNAFFVQGIQQRTNLQQVYEAVAAQAKELDAGNKVVSLRAFVKDGKVQGGIYVVFRDQPSKKLSRKLEKMRFDAPNPV